MSNSAKFEVHYWGEVLDNHEMDIKELAPALLAISETIEKSNNLLNKGRAGVSVKVSGTFKTGSFGFETVLIQDIATQLNLALHSDAVITAGALLAIIGWGTVKDIKDSVFALIQWLKNRSIQNVKKLPNNMVEIELVDEKKRWSLNVFNLFASYEVRKSIEHIIVPLTKKGIEGLDIYYKSKKTVEIKKDEAKYFETPKQEEKLIDTKQLEISLQVISAVFQENNKWRFTDGTNTFYAVIEDFDFINRVNQNIENFAKDDIFKVQLEIKQYETEKGIRADYTIKSVLDHRRLGTQLLLPLDSSFKEDNDEEV